LKNSHSHLTSIKLAEKTFKVEEHQHNKSIMTSSTEATATASYGRRESLSLEDIMGKGEEQDQKQQHGNSWSRRSRSFVEVVPALAHGGNKLIGSLWTSMGAATEWFTYNEQQQQQQQQLKLAADNNISRSGTNNRSNTTGGTAKRWLFADSIRALCTRTTSKRQTLGAQDSRSSLSSCLNFDEMAAIRNEIAQTRQAVHEAIEDMELDSEDWKKLQRTLRVMNHRTFTNQGAKIALGQLIVDASLAESKPVNPLQTHHHRGDRRTAYAASKKIAKSSIRQRHLMSSMNMSSRHHPYGTTSSSHGRSLTDSASSLGIFDADQHHDPEESFTVQDLLQSASTRKMEALYFVDEYGVDQRQPKSQDSSMNNISSSLNSSWNEMDMRLSQLSQKNGGDGPTWVVVATTNSTSSSSEGSSDRRAVNGKAGSVSRGGHASCSKLLQSSSAVEPDRCRASFGEVSGAAVRVGQSFAVRAYDALSRTAATLASGGTAGFHDSSELLSDAIDELDEEETSSSSSSSNDHTSVHAPRRRRGALTGASTDEVQQDIAIALYRTHTDKNNSNINKPAVHSDFADSPLRLKCADGGHELPGARDKLELPAFPSIPKQLTMIGRAA
jgi:hypothetical protein